MDVRTIKRAILNGELDKSLSSIKKTIDVRRKYVGEIKYDLFSVGDIVIFTHEARPAVLSGQRGVVKGFKTVDRGNRVIVRVESRGEQQGEEYQVMANAIDFPDEEDFEDDRSSANQGTANELPETPTRLRPHTFANPSAAVYGQTVE